MPELPEVETIVRQLRKVIVGKKVVEVEVYKEKSFVGSRELVVGHKIEEVFRKAKILGFEIEGETSVLVHLKMTGQLIWRPDGWEKLPDPRKEVVGGHPSEDWIGKLPSKHTRVVWRFDDGSRMFFNDMRVFGWMKVVNREESRELLNKLPPDVTDDEFDLEYFEKSIHGVRRAIKIVIMDTQRMGGVGNIYANDALWEAGVDPRKRACDLKSDERERLYLAMRFVLQMGIKYGGATSANFVNLDGLGGKYQEHFLVYKRDGQECLRCKTKILKCKVGGRGTFWCPRCQQ